MCINIELRWFFLSCLVLAERAMTTLNVIGPAVLNGGLSTFLAFVLLGFSQAYVFKAFFRVRIPKCAAYKI